MATKIMSHLTQALDEESWQWLQDNVPNIAAAVEKEVAAGHSPQDIKRGVNTHSQRYALALRCEQAARHVISLHNKEI